MFQFVSGVFSYGQIRKNPVVNNPKRSVVLKLTNSGKLIKTFNDADYKNGYDILWQTYVPFSRVTTGPYKLVLENDCRVAIYDRDNDVVWRNTYFSYTDGSKAEEHPDEDPTKEVEYYEKNKLLRTTTSTTTTRRFSSFDLDDDQVDEIEYSSK